MNSIRSDKQDWFSDSNWQQVDYYELSSKSELWQSAFYITINKAVAAKAEEALINLLERFVIEKEGWDKKSIRSFNSTEFEGFLQSEYGFTRYWKQITVEKFWDNFDEITNSILRVPGAYISKNSTIEIKEIPLSKKAVLTVKMFTDQWNLRQYLIETSHQWAFFHWSTSV